MCRLHQIFFILLWTYGYWYRQLRRLDKHCITYYQRCHLMACFYRPLSIPHACQDPIFFQFLRVFTKVEEACQEFSPQWFATTLQGAEDSAKVWKALLKAQQLAVYEWFDRFRTGISKDVVLKMLPANLRSPDFGDHDRWCLGRHRAACVKRYLAVCAPVCVCLSAKREILCATFHAHITIWVLFFCRAMWDCINLGYDNIGMLCTVLPWLEVAHA